MLAALLGAMVSLPLSVFGYDGGTTITGTNPRFDLYVPDYRGASKLTARFALFFPPQADKKAVVVLRVDGAPIAQSTVGALRDEKKTLDGSFEKFRGSNKMIDVSVETYLTMQGNDCREYDPRNLWMFVSPKSELQIAHSDAPPATVADFFNDYDGRYEVKLAPGASDDLHLSAVSLAYWVNQIERWRKIHTSFESPQPRPARTIVVGDAKDDLTVRDGILHANARGVDLIASRGVSTILAPSAAGTAVIKGKLLQSPVTLQTLGIGTRTQRGAGRFSFPVVFSLGTFGGLPDDLHANLQIAHGPFKSGDRAAVTVLLNGAVINGFMLSQSGKTEYFNVPLDELRLVGSNVLDVQVEFVPSGTECSGGRPSISVSLLGGSTFSWGALTHYPPSIGEFVNELSGDAGVAIADAQLDRAAFTLLDRIGVINPDIRHLEMHRYRGEPLANVSAGIYVAPADQLKAFPIAYDPATGEMRVRNASGKSIYEARLDVPYGIVQTVRTDVASLVMTYAKAPSALDSFPQLRSAELSSAPYDIVLFNERGIAYTNPAETLADKRRAPTPLRSSWPLLVAVGVVIVVALWIIARRARRVS